MSVLAGKELRIVGFLCNWCSYGGADTAGTARAVQPTDLRIIRVPCSGRVNPLFVLKALINGADGVLVSGCHPRDCHYSAGNYYARRRLEMLKQFLPVLSTSLPPEEIPAMQKKPYSRSAAQCIRHDDPAVSEIHNMPLPLTE